MNLYRMVSWSHLDYYSRVPRIPKSVLQKHREGLIIGSACEAGELYQALVRSAPEEEIARLVNFYDYLEIQPLGNNEFMLRGERPTFESKEDLIRLNKRIVALGEQFHKPVVATCDVHFLNPEDEVYRRIIMAGKGFKDADEQAPLYLSDYRRDAGGIRVPGKRQGLGGGGGQHEQDCRHDRADLSGAPG